jgi:hypothetical protein
VLRRQCTHQEAFGPARLRDHLGLIEYEGPRHIDLHRFAVTFKLPAVKSAA